MSQRAAIAYRRVYLESASPARTLDELYGRLLQDCRDARGAIGAGNVSEKARHIGHGLAIIQELEAALDRGQAPELCGRLAELYRFGKHALLDASLKMDATPIAPFEKIVTGLRGAFRKAAGDAA
jgi:flagellar biosynthetic protein FliS